MALSSPVACRPLTLLVVVVCAAALLRTVAGVAVDCSSLPSGFYCLSPSAYLWCYGQSQGAAGSCASPLVCKCGLTTENPCGWQTSTITPCYGAPGDYINTNGQTTKPLPIDDPSTDSSSAPAPSQPLYVLNRTNHLPLVIKLSPSSWRTQLSTLMAQAFYDDPNLYTPASSGYQCSFHPPPSYDHNPTQMWIARPEATTTISFTPDVTIRLPDKYAGLFLAYAMDQYGLNPSMLLGLAAKESFMPVIFNENDNSYFIVNDAKAHYDCYSATKEGLCTDLNKDGPFQVETGGMSSDVSSIAYRFYAGSLGTPKASRTPRYLTDNEFMTMPGFRAFHDSYTLDMPRAVVLTALDFHFRHNILLSMKRIGLYDALARRTTRASKDSLEFATAMYAYNRGVFDTQITTMLAGCTPTADPVTCGLDGYGGHTANIRDACLLLDLAPSSQLYDYGVTLADVNYFLDKLESTYPYDSVSGFHPSIDWAEIRADATEAFGLLQAYRKQRHPTGDSTPVISFRYDWRALLSVVRMRLPPREYLVGPSVQNYVNFWGNQLAPTLGPYVSPASFPVSFCSLPGGEVNLCSGNTETTDPCIANPLSDVCVTQCVRSAAACHTAMGSCLIASTAASQCACYTPYCACLQSACGAAFGAAQKLALSSCSSCAL
eukprot:TRINITY_DN8095_c0_g1_i1.p1 TRINITY_DN8095_c0_g1~~TRINITY_DN8095_c0_g1_i1.p1  ORF type:complete len:660 (-),score=100.50 TRINITY_DN8095_c0_g1_i1:51-2030(-)